MKKTLKYIIMGGVAFSALFNSCKKEFLDRKPYTADALKTASDMQIALTGTYA